MKNAGTRHDRPPSAQPIGGANGSPRAENGIARIRALVSEELERLLTAHMAEGPGSLISRERSSARDVHGAELRRRVQERVRFLGQIAAGLAGMGADALPAEGAGFGSSVVVEDLDTSEMERYTLMAGAVLDLNAGQVSLVSPIGQALLGRRAGDVAIVTTPQRQRRLRVVSVVTIQDLLETDPLLTAGDD